MSIFSDVLWIKVYKEVEMTIWILSRFIRKIKKSLTETEISSSHQLSIWPLIEEL